MGLWAPLPVQAYRDLQDNVTRWFLVNLETDLGICTKKQACNNTQKYAEIRRNTQAKTPSKNPKQKHAGDSNTKNFKIQTTDTYPQGIIKKCLQKQKSANKSGGQRM